MLVNLVIVTSVFQLSSSTKLSWPDVALRAGLATLFREILQAVGRIYVRHVLAPASPTYGFLAMVIGAQLTLLAGEINVVRRYRLGAPFDHPAAAYGRRSPHTSSACPTCNAAGLKRR